MQQEIQGVFNNTKSKFNCLSILTGENINHGEFTCYWWKVNFEGQNVQELVLFEALIFSGEGCMCQS